MSANSSSSKELLDSERIHAVLLKRWQDNIRKMNDDARDERNDRRAQEEFARLRQHIESLRPTKAPITDTNSAIEWFHYLGWCEFHDQAVAAYKAP
jgi:hypothetical protein